MKLIQKYKISGFDYLIFSCSVINLIFASLYIYDINSDRQTLRDINFSIGSNYNADHKTFFIELGIDKNDYIDLGNNNSLFRTIERSQSIKVFYSQLFNFPNYTIIEQTRFDLNKLSFNIKLIISLVLGLCYPFFLKTLENKSTPIVSGLGNNMFSSQLIGTVYLYQIGFSFYAVYNIYVIFKLLKGT